MSSSATALFLRFSDGEDHSKFMARSTSLLVIHNTQNKEEQSFDSMCRYQFLGGFPTANLTSNNGGILATFRTIAHTVYPIERLCALLCVFLNTEC